MDAILLRKAGSLERCIARVLDKYQGNEAAFDDDIDLQDIIVLNLQRACQTAIDMALRIGRLRRLALYSSPMAWSVMPRAAATSPSTSTRSSTSKRSATSSSIASTICWHSARRCCRRTQVAEHR